MANIADMIMQSGNAQANARLQGGQITSNAVAGIGSMLGSAVAQLPQQKLEQQKNALTLSDMTTRAADAKLTYDEHVKEVKDADAAEKILAAHRGPDGALDYKAATRDLLGAGLVKKAGEIQAQSIAAQKAQAEMAASQLDQSIKGLRAAAGFARGITDQESFNRLMPVIKDTVGPQLAGHLPTAYDPKSMEAVQQWGATAEESLALQKFAADKAKAALDSSKTASETFESWRKSYSATVAATTSQAGFDANMNIYARTDAPKDLLMKYGTKWSPAIVATARKEAIGPKDEAELGIKATAAGLSSRETNDRADATRLQRAQEWRSDALRDLRAEFRKTVTIKGVMGDETKPAMTKEERQQSEDEINKSYAEMIAGNPRSAAPAAAPVTRRDPAVPLPPNPEADSVRASIVTSADKAEAKKVLTSKGMPASDADVKLFLAQPRNLAGIRTRLGGGK
jgi:hypothetical protein